MLPDPGRGQDNLLRLLFGEDAIADALGDLRFEGPLQGGSLEFVLAEKGELTTVFKAEEIRQAILAYAFGAGRSQQDPVDISEMYGVIPEHGTGQDVALAAVGAGTVQIGHFGQDT